MPKIDEIKSEINWLKDLFKKIDKDINDLGEL